MLQPLATSGDAATCQWRRGPPRRRAARPTTAFTACSSAGSHHCVDSREGVHQVEVGPLRQAGHQHQRRRALVHPDPDRAAAAGGQPVEHPRLRGRVGRARGHQPGPQRQLAQAAAPPQAHRAPCCGARPGAPSAQPILSSTGSSLARSPIQSGAPITPSRSTSSAFQGWTMVAATMPDVASARDVHRAVVHQHVDAQLLAAGDLVERAVQVVVGHADLLEPALGGRPGAAAAVARHVDPVAALVPVAHGLDGVGIRLAGGDVLVRMGLLDAVHERVALEGRDAPVVLVLIGQMHPVALLHDALKEVPVGVQRRVDVQRDPGHRRTTVGACPECSLPTPCPATPRRARSAGQDYGETAEPSWRNVDWRALLRTHPFGGSEINYIDLIPEDPAAQTARRWCSSTGSAASGRTGSRTSRAWPWSAAPSRSTCPGSGSPPMPAEQISISGYAEVVEAACQRPRPGNRGGRGQLDGRLRGRRAGDPATRSGWSGSMLVSAAGITTTDLYRAPVLRARRGRHHGHRLHRRPPPRRRAAAESRGTWRWRSWPGTRAGWRPTWSTRP